MIRAIIAMSLVMDAEIKEAQERHREEILQR